MTTGTSLTAEREELRSVARAVLADGQASPELWGELGWLGLGIAETDGGCGGAPADLAVILTENGRVLGSGGPASAGLAGLVLSEAPETPARFRYLPRIADGSSRATLAATSLWAPPDAWPVAVPDRDGYRLSGRVPFVADADGADVLLVPAMIEGAEALLAVDATLDGVDIAVVPTMDRTRRFATVTFRGAAVPSAAIVAQPAAPLLDRARVLAAFALACDSLGGAEASLEATVAYVSQRRQFGRPVGAFQALQHRCADLLITLETARGAVDRAAGELTAGGAGWVSLAKWRAADGYVAIAGDSVQLHGGIGFTWEGGRHQFLKRAKLNQALCGDPSWHRRRVYDWMVGSC